MNNILVISFVPLNTTLEKILFLNSLKERYKIYYCYINFNFSKNDLDNEYIVNKIKKYEFKNFESFDSFFNNFSNSNTIINFVRYRSLKYIKIFKYIKNLNFPSYEFRYVLPYLHAKFKLNITESCIRNIKKYLNYQNYLIYYHERIKLKKHVYFSNFNIKNTVRINYFDVENNINFKIQNSNNYKDYILFIDSHIHDGTDSKFDNSIRPKLHTHYDLVNKFINKIENIFKKEVLISGHPKYQNDYKGLFKDKKIFFNSNKELIDNSSFVFCFDTSAVYYAIYKLKKIIFLFSEEIIETSSLRHNKYGSIKIHADQLSAQTFNMNNYQNLNHNSFNDKVNINSYKKFINDYLFSNERQSFEIIDNKIKEFL